ncbi:MAG TPA: PspA/IM30 family protein [Polyangiaceae bacterium]
MRWKLMTTSFVAKIDGLIAQIENHEAQVTSALKDLEQGISRSKVQLVRVERDGAALRQALAEEKEAIERWRERARREEVEQRALECLRRSKRSEARTGELATQSSEHERVEQQLRRDVQTLERRLVELRQQRNTMRTRQSRAEALEVVQGSASLDGTEIGAIFERWETRVTESEIASGCLTTSADSLDEEFSTAEEEAALRLELRALKEVE